MRSCFHYHLFSKQAFTQEDAEDGIVFMQEMIELAKQRNEEDGKS